MALKLYERYPQLWESPSNDYPQGAFKNLSAQGETDGSYLEKDWLNDYSGFFGALLRNAQMTPNGTIDTAQRSQFYDALVKVAKSAVADQGYATKTYVDNKFNEVPKTEIINDWDQASDENVFSAEFLSNRLRKTVEDFGVVGDGITDDTASFLDAKEYFDSLGEPIRVNGTKLILLKTPIIFDKDYAGIIFEEGSVPYSYQGLSAIKSGLLFEGVGEEDVGVTVKGKGVNLHNVNILSKDKLGFGLEVLGYSGEYRNVRILNFEGSLRLTGSNTSECIFNKFDRVDCYSLRYGLVAGVDKTWVETDGAVNENTFINCRFRGVNNALYLTRKSNPQSYGFVFINCIFQETPPMGDGFYDIVYIGKNIRGVSFINGRIESPTQAGRKQPRINTLDKDATKSNIYMYGTYIISSMQFTDIKDIQGYSVFDTTFRVDSLESNTFKFNPNNPISFKNGQNSFESTLKSINNSIEFFNSTRYQSSENSYIRYEDRFRGSGGVVWSYTERKSHYSEGKATYSIIFGDSSYDFNSTAILPSGDLSLGSSSRRFQTIYLTNQPNVSSDIRLKRDVEDIDRRYLDVVSKLNYKQYILTDNIDSRLRFGIIAQDWINACNEVGLNPLESTVLEGDDEVGYSVRYADLQILINAYILHKLKL